MAAAADYTAALHALMPRGRVWPTEPGSNITQVLGALAQTPSRVDAAAAAILAGSLPGENADLLTEWEDTLGLPDPCAGTNPTTAQRAAQVRARFIGGGGQSLPFFVAFAAALGFTVTIETFISFRTDVSTVETPLYDDDWNFAWGVKVLANEFGTSTDVLLCELTALKPAHTFVFVE